MLKQVSLHITNRCNFKCKYCYVPKSNKDMPVDLAYRAVRFARQLYGDDDIVLTFFGGEPLMAFEKIKKIISFARRKAGINNFLVDTNGSAIDKEKIAFFKANNVDLGISSDGVARVQNFTRPLMNGKESWALTDRILGRVNLYYGGLFRKAACNPPCVGITFTPDTVDSLGDSVRYLVNKFEGKRIYISIIPAMPLTEECEKIAKNNVLLYALRKQMKKIADLYIDKFNNNEPFNLTINFCFFADKWSDLAGSRAAVELPSCCGGSEKIFVSLDGRLYPCHIPAANPGINDEFCAGDVVKGIIRPEVLHRFSSFKNKEFSCLYWNYLVSKDLGKPAKVYSILFKSWLESIAYIRKSIPSH